MRGAADSQRAGVAEHAPRAAVEEDRARVEHRQAVFTRCGSWQQVQRHRRRDQRVQPENAQRHAPALRVERVGFDFQHRAGQHDLRMCGNARIQGFVEPTAEGAVALAQLEVGLAVDAAHRGAEFAERRFIDQVHRERQRHAQHDGEPGAQVAPDVVAQLGPGKLPQQGGDFDAHVGEPLSPVSSLAPSSRALRERAPGRRAAPLPANA